MPHKRKKKSERDSAKKESGFDNVPKAGDLSIASSGNRRADWILNSHTYLNMAEKKKREMAQSPGPAQLNKKRKLTETPVNSKPKYSDLQIQPGEKLRDFNRRVEMNLQPEVAAAIKASKQAEVTSAAEEKAERKKKKADAYAATIAKQLEDDAMNGSEKPALSRSQIHKQKVKAANAATQAEATIQEEKPIKEFATATQVTYLNDIAVAPPVFKKLPKGAVKTNAGARSKDILKPKTNSSLHAQKVLAAERERAIEMYREHKNKIWVVNNAERDRQAALDLE